MAATLARYYLIGGYMAWRHDEIDRSGQMAFVVVWLILLMTLVFDLVEACGRR